MSGIVSGKSCQPSNIASRVPGNAYPDARVKQLSRWVNNEAITFNLYFLPFMEPLPRNLAATWPLVLMMDGSAVAWGCVILIVSPLYAGRRFPLRSWSLRARRGIFRPRRTRLCCGKSKPEPPANATVAPWRERMDMLGPALAARLNRQRFSMIM